MRSMLTSKKAKWAGRLFVALFSIMLASSLMATQTFAQDGPKAGTQIGNQATATFQDAGGNTRTVTSNVVNTVVQQVASVTVDANLSKQISPGGQVTFPFTITNNGNGDDTFTLALSQQTGDDFDFNSIQVFADADGDGNPDDFNDLNGSSTPSIASGGTFSVVVVGTVPNNVNATEQALVDLTATSDFDSGTSDAVTGTAIVSEDAVISVTKSMNQTNGQPGDTRTVTLTFTNSGNNTATNISITDQLPSEMEFQTGTAQWSEGGALDDTDPNNDPAGIDFDYDVTTSGVVTAVLDDLDPGQSGTISFDIQIAAGTQPGTLENTAVFEYNDGNSDEGPFNSNTVQFTVEPSLGVTLTATNSPIAQASQGGSVDFNNDVTNTGNATDTYDIELSNSNYPSGTSFILFKSDGVSPLLDTDGNGVPDTGPIDPGNTVQIIVKVDLPSGVSGGGPFTVDVTGTSVTDNSINDSDVNELTTITGNTVDLTANDDINNGNTLTPDDADAADGLGSGPEASAVDVQTIDPGNTATFTLFVNNTSSVSDNFDLLTSTDQTFATTTLPDGVTVKFEDTNGSTITNTGTINAGSSKEIVMKVTFPSSADAGQTDFFVRAKSPSTSAEDIITTGVDVNTVRKISLSPNNSGQVFPGSSVLYTHTLSNEGNVDENPTQSELTLSSTDSQTEFNTVLYLDSNENGEIDNSEPIIDDASDIPTLAAGSSVQIIAKVSATSGVSDGLDNTTTITASVTGTINGVAAPADVQATDLTTVINSNVTIVKRQALDANTDGVADNSPQTTEITAEPGQGIFYEVVVTNQGTEAINNVFVDDAIPSFTTINGSPSITNGQSVAVNSGVVNADIGTLNPGQSATLEFAVIIDN